MRFLSAGQSHGEALAGILSEFPSGVEINTDFINDELKSRQAGFGRGARMSIEKDSVSILSGVSKGKTTGAPISFLIKNLDWDNWKDRLDIEEDITNPRPGHADLTGMIKFRLKSARDVIERSSARETAVRVVAGSFAKLFLLNFNIFTLSYVEQIGNICIDEDSYRLNIKKNFNPVKSVFDKSLIDKISDSMLRCPDEIGTAKMIKLIKNTAKQSDTLGGSFRVFATGISAGLGSFSQWDTRLDAKITASIMSIPSVKAVAFGNGLNAGFLRGTEFHDEIFYSREEGFFRKGNNAGGIEGGMTNGENIEVKAIIKPIPTTPAGLKTVDFLSKSEAVSLKERSDICAVPSAAFIAEAMLAVEVLNAMLDKFGNDNLDEILGNYKNYRDYISNL